MKWGIIQSAPVISFTHLVLRGHFLALRCLLARCVLLLNVLFQVSRPILEPVLQRLLILLLHCVRHPPPKRLPGPILRHPILRLFNLIRPLRLDKETGRQDSRIMQAPPNVRDGWNAVLCSRPDLRDMCTGLLACRLGPIGHHSEVKGHVHAFGHFKILEVRVWVRGYGHIVHETVPLLPILTIEYGIVDGLWRNIDPRRRVDGKDAAIGYAMTLARTGVGWVVEGFASQFLWWCHCKVFW